jgi:type II secretion system protein C
MGKALIEDQTSKSAKLYREGEKVAPMTAVEQILAKKVILNRDGAREVLLLAVTEATPGARISSSAQMVARLPSLPAGPPGTVTVDRSEWMNKGLEEIIGEGKVTAVWKDGQIEGLKVTNIARNEYAQTLGLRENDVVVSINGVPLRSTDEALALAEKLQKAPVVRVQVLRNGRPEVLTYRMSDLGGLSRQRGRP